MSPRQEIKELISKIEELIVEGEDFKNPKINDLAADLKERLEQTSEGPIKGIAYLDLVELFALVFPQLPAMVQRTFIEYALTFWKEKPETLFLNNAQCSAEPLKEANGG